jgi:hypothetical protein
LSPAARGDAAHHRSIDGTVHVPDTMPVSIPDSLTDTFALRT